MKLKRKYFARLKDIAESVNQVLPGTGIKLDKLIADIESVQKQKEEFSLIDIDQLRKDMEEQKVETIKEEPISPSELAIKRACDKHRKSGDDSIQKELDTNPIHQAIKSVLKRQKEAIGNAKYNIENKYGWDKNPLGVDAVEALAEQKTERPLRWSDLPNGGNIEVKEDSDLDKVLNPPKIGDVGYFWEDDCFHAMYGKMAGKLPGNSGMIYGILCHGTTPLYYTNFSKTPPELK